MRNPDSYSAKVDAELPDVSDLPTLTVDQLRRVVRRLDVRARHYYGRKADLVDEVQEFLRRRVAGEPVGHVEYLQYRAMNTFDEMNRVLADKARADVLFEAVSLLEPLLESGSADYRQGVEGCMRALAEAAFEARAHAAVH